MFFASSQTKADSASRPRRRHAFVPHVIERTRNAASFIDNTVVNKHYGVRSIPMISFVLYHNDVIYPGN